MSHATRPTDRLSTPTAAEVQTVSALYAAHGLVRAVALLGVGRHTLDRLRGGLPVRRSTLTQARVALGLLAQQERRP